MNNIKIRGGFHKFYAFYFLFHGGIVIFTEIQLKDSIVEMADFLDDLFQFTHLQLLGDAAFQFLPFVLSNVRLVNSGVLVV